MFVLLVFITQNVNKLHAQNPLDSLMIYTPYEEAANIRRLLTTYFSRLGDVNESLIKKYSEGIELAKKNNSLKDEADLLVKSATIYFRAGIYETALEYYFNALKKYQDIGDSINTAIVEIEIGRTYYFSDLLSATDFIETGAATLEKSNDPELIAYALYGKGIVEKDELKSSSHFKKALEIQLEVIKKKPNDFESNSKLSRYYNTNGKTELALEIAEKIKDDWLTVLYLNNIGYALVLNGNPQKSLSYFFRSHDICIANRYKTLLRNTYDNIGRAYRLVGDYKKSVYYLRYMHFVEERIFREQFATQASISRVKYETEKKELENKFLKEQQKILAENLKYEKIQKIFLTSLVFIIFFIAFYIYYSRRKIKAANLLLDQKHKEVLKQKGKLESLYKELKTSEENLNVAQGIAKTANWELDIKNDKFSFSKQLPIIYGVDAELLKSDFRSIIIDRIHPDDKEEFSNYYDHLADAENLEVEYRIVNKKEIKWIRANRITIRDENGLVYKIFGTIHDFTERKEEEQIKMEIAAKESYTKQLIESTEEERKRIAGELHDGLGQDILLIKNRAQLCLQNENLDSFTSEQITEINNSISGILKVIREISLDLRPAHLERIGLTETILAMINKVDKLSTVQITESIDNIDNLLIFESKINFYRIIQEGLNNIVKHSKANTAKIEIFAKEDNIHINIIDDGKGFKLKSGIEISGGFGLNNMLHRVRILGGNLNIVSEPTKGTRVEIIIPVKKNGK